MNIEFYRSVYDLSKLSWLYGDSTNQWSQDYKDEQPECLNKLLPKPNDYTSERARDPMNQSRSLLEQHWSKQRPSWTQEVSTNQQSYDRRIGECDYSSELPYELDLYKPFLRDLEFQANLEEIEKWVD
ncbi:hypothetical protein PVK06_005049 [Gossypium arboreum]|uniref:Uncharacterized protein n=1 Tax=Gossypium arboreum TaxID=29729 RepID=A0ABR0QTK7_GOSAR|nr:hypothetical protein PVK06_005049 [Gossypium arboreum]